MKKKAVFLIALLGLAFLTYSNCLDNSFLLDDSALILNNPVLNNQKSASSVFSSGLYPSSPYMYRPLQTLSYYLDYKLWGFNPFGFHLSNIILHGINSFLVYILLSIIIPASGIASFVSILFAVHPVNTSIVSYVSARADLLAVMFILLTLISVATFIKTKARYYYALSLLFGFLSFLSRENSLLLFPFVLLIASYCKKGLKLSLLYASSFLAMGGGYLVFRYGLFGYFGSGSMSVNMPVPLLIANFVNLIPRYLLLLIWPAKLHMFRSVEFINPYLNLRVVSSGLILLIIVVLPLFLRKNRLFLLAFYWFLLGLTPVLFLFNGYPWLKMAMMAESWVYLPSIGVFILTAVVINKLKRPGKALFIIIIFLLILCSRYNNTLWRNNISVYQNTLKYLPEDNPVRKNLIYEYLKFGLYDLAFQEIGKFSRSYPDSSERFLLQGDYYYAINVIQEARKNYETALRLNASDAYARKMLEKIEAENAK